jgi:hypothetical protein
MTKANLENGGPWRFGPIGPANGAGPRPVRARPAKGPRISAMDGAPCTVADPQDPRQGMA